MKGLLGRAAHHAISGAAWALAGLIVAAGLALHGVEAWSER